MMNEFLRIYTCILFINSICAINSLNRDGCRLWHFRKNGRCEKGDLLRGKIKFDGESLSVKNSHCMTWNNKTQFAEVSYCLLARCRQHQDTTGYYKIPTDMSGDELNRKSCQKHSNRKGHHCHTCIDGYGPAVLYDGFTCADCSKNKHLWVLNLIFQLACVAFTYMVTIFISIKGTSSPLNITITYSQLCVNILMISSRHQDKLVCRFGESFALFTLTLFGVFNLDYFRYLIPPLCLNTSASPIDVLLFDYVVAISPFIYTVVCYLCIIIHDRNCHNRIVIILSSPLKKCFQRHKNWKPKETILNTYATLLLCGYTKLLFVSVNLLVGTQSYNSHGEKVPNSTVLLFDPTLQFFSNRHIPYIIIALTVITVFVLLPPMLLILYPTQLFRKCLEYCGFRNWGILHMTMEVFQGWFKDGTNNTHDYRQLSAFYMLLRIGIGCTFILVIYTDYDGYQMDIIFGVLHVFFGMFFYIVRPYKKTWMNNTDGFLLVFTGAMLLLTDFTGRVYIVVATISSIILAVAYLYAVYKFIKLLC